MSGTATIVVSFMFSADEPTQRHELAAGGTLAEALMELSADRWGGRTFELHAGAVGFRSLVPPETATEIVLQAGEVWHVRVLPAEAVTASVIAAALIEAGVTAATAATIAAVAAFIIITAISMAIAYGVSMLLRPGKSTDKAGAAADQPTALNSLSIPTNTMRPLSRIPEIYGRLRTWPDLILPGWSEWEMVAVSWQTHIENKETTSVQRAIAVYCVGRGAYQLDTFRFADSQLDTQAGSVQAFPPGVTLPPDIKRAWAVQNLSRVELPGIFAPSIWTAWFDITAEGIDTVLVQIHWPSGMIVQVSGSKVSPPYNVLPGSATISVQGERLDPDGVVLESHQWDNPVAAQTTNELRQTFRMDGLTPGRWRFRVADTAPLPPPPNRGNTGTLIKKGFLEGILGLSPISEDDRTFETETVLVVRASNRSGTSTQNLEAFNCIATRVLPTQADGAPAGVLTGPVPDTRWITAAINTLTDPVVCNYSADEIDWPSLVEVQAALEAYPEGLRERNFNGIFDRLISADEQLQTVARRARAIAFMSNGRVSFARDQRRDGVSALFNRRNRLSERGGFGLGLRPAGPDDHDGVEISWFNERDDFRQSTTSWPPGVSLFNPLSIDLIGATVAHEICRRARFEWAAMRYRRRTQPLRVTEEAQLLSPFDRVAIVAPWDEGIVDGEVLEIDGLDIRLDRPVPAGLPDTARIRLRAPDGRETSLHAVTASGAGPDWLTLATAPVFTMIVPGPDRQLGTLYNLSRADNFEAASHWLVSGAEIDDRGVTLTLMEDDDTVYVESDDLIDPCAEEQPPEPAPSSRQWRVWLLGAALGGVADGNVRIAQIEMATSPGGSNMAATGTTSSPPNVVGANNAFDGNPATTMSTTMGDRLWVQKTFPAQVLLAEIRVQAWNSFSSSSAPQVVVIFCRDDDAEAWKAVHVSTGVVWTLGEWKTFTVATVRPTGQDNALAWRLRWTKTGVSGLPELSFDGLTNDPGQGFSDTSQATQRARQAFDGDLATDWVATATGERRLGMVLAVPAGASPDSVTVTGYLSGGTLAWLPTDFVVEWSDDLEAWTQVASVSSPAWTGPPRQVRIFPI